MPEDAWSALYSKYGGGKVEVSANSMGLFEKCKKVLLTPSEFFEKIKTERDILEAFKYLVVLSLIPVVAAGISLTSFFYYYRSMVVPSFVQPLLGNSITVISILIPIAIFILNLILSFSFAGVIHLSVKLLKGKGDYSDTYKALIYSETPPYLFGWLPYVGLIFGLYGFYLFLKGISKLHEVSMGRAFVIAILPGAIVVIIAVAAVVTFWYFVPAPPPVPSIPITGRLLSVISKIPVS